MYKKITAVAALAAMQTIAHADGLYVGGHVGRDTNQVELSNTSVFGTATSKATSNFGGEGIDGGLFAGYGQSFDNFYLGAELFGNLNSAKAKVANKTTAPATQDTVSMQIKNSYGVDLIPAYNLNKKVRLYGRVGVVEGKYEASVTSNDADFQDFTKADDDVTGLHAGLGVQVALTENVDMRMEYVLSDYEKTTVQDSLGNAVSYHPQSNQFNLGLVMRLG